MTVHFRTSGSGLWSTHTKDVQIVDIRMRNIDSQLQFAELCVYFNTRSWDVESMGLIYTDPGFISDLECYLTQIGLPNDIDYSEQGMQGDDYVSFDAGPEIVLAWVQNRGRYARIRAEMKEVA